MKLTKKQKRIAIIIPIIVVTISLLYFFKIFPFNTVSGTCATVSCAGECKDLGFPPQADCCGYGQVHNVFGDCVSGGGGGGGGCSADCSCASSTCRGSSCSDGCGGTCAGSKVCCSSNWQCGSWSSCNLGIQVRSCNDINNCGSSSGKPSETQTCTNPQTNCNYQDQTLEIGQSLCLEGKQISCISVEGVPTIDDSKSCDNNGILILIGGVGLSGGLYYLYRRWKK